MEQTEIGGRMVPIKQGPKSTIMFSGGSLAPDQPGNREFWTAVGPLDRTAGVRVRRHITIRCPPEDDPGLRFREMEHRPVEAEGWKFARRAEHLRPATAEEVESWLNDKLEDASHAGMGQVAGKNVRVVKEGGRYRVVPQTT